MKLKYSDFIEQTYSFPQDEFQLKRNWLEFHGIPLKEVIDRFGTPLKFVYLPKISENIQRAKTWFNKAIDKHQYPGDYHYCYCTKSSHFSFVLKEALKNDIHLETSFSTDLDIVEKLYKRKQIGLDKCIICNGVKTDHYIDHIIRLKNLGFSEVIPILDSTREFDRLNRRLESPTKIGIRIASEEEPKFEFYSSRLGIGYKDVLPLYKQRISSNPRFELNMLHFFINTGIRDTSYYWNELNKCLNLYVQLREICPDLQAFNIGGGFPIKNSLAFEYDYEKMVDEIVRFIKEVCETENVPTPDIYTEFGSFTVGESGGAIFEVMHQKKQNDREHWNIIDSSFITNLPDAWALNKRFILLPVNRWNDPYERIFLGGLTCDSDDYYSSEQHLNAIYLPKYKEDEPLYVGFFNTGAYQESLGGFGGYQHCLVPNLRHLLIDRKEEGSLEYRLFSEEQSPEDMLRLLGY